jgi:hypothetical protein
MGAKRMFLVRTDITLGEDHPEMNVSGRSCRKAVTVFTHGLITRRTT